VLPCYPQKIPRSWKFLGIAFVKALSIDLEDSVIKAKSGFYLSQNLGNLEAENQ